jgi:hypothetical protein
MLNQRCAFRAAAASLNVPSNAITFPSCQLRWLDGHSYYSSYLKAFLQTSEELLADDCAIVTLSSFPRWEAYNVDNDVCWDDIHFIEYLMNLCALLDTRPT